jgi:hypothetical protein
MPSGPPCSRCQKLSQSCQFVEEPSKRKRPNQGSLDVRANDKSPSLTDFLATFGHTDGQNGESNLWTIQSDTNGIDLDAELRAASQPQGVDFVLFGSARTPAVAGTRFQRDNSRTWSPTASLDLFPREIITLEGLSDSFSFYVGPTGTSDISLLSRHAKGVQSLARHVAAGLSFRQVSANPQWQDTIFGVTEHRLIESVEPRFDKKQNEQAWARLWDIVDCQTALELCRLYFRFVNPYFPVMAVESCPQDLQSTQHISLALLAGMCGTAVPFMLYEEKLYDLLPSPPSAQDLYRLCWFGICQELHAPTLCTVQACLLLQHHLPANPVLADTAFKWSLTSMTISAAQTIGLHRDPMTWDLVPQEECKLRQRVWWAAWTMEKWIGLARGMPTLVSVDDVTVSPLEANIAGVVLEHDYTADHFEHLTTLTMILHDIRTTYYTAKGEYLTANDLQESLACARPIRGRLRDWQAKLPSSLKSWMMTKTSGTDALLPGDPRRLDGNASLHLSYIVTHIMLFRALLRPLNKVMYFGASNTTTDIDTQDGIAAIITGSIFCGRELVEFLECLTEPLWNAFWHCWSRSNFAMAGSFMVDLLLTISSLREAGASQHGPKDNVASSSEGARQHEQISLFETELTELQRLIERWRWATRVSANSAAGVKGLTNLALFKVETMLAELRKENSH